MGIQAVALPEVELESVEFIGVGMAGGVWPAGGAGAGVSMGMVLLSSWGGIELFVGLSIGGFPSLEGESPLGGDPPIGGWLSIGDCELSPFCGLEKGDQKIVLFAESEELVESVELEGVETIGW